MKTARQIKMARIEVKRTWAEFIAAVAAQKAAPEITPGNVTALAIREAANQARWAADAKHINAKRRLEAMFK